MAEIQFGTPDSGGDYPESLASPRPTPADRFWDFTPNYSIVGPDKAALGDASIHTFVFREDYTAVLEIRHLAPSQLETALALMKALINGETVRVVTSDADSNVYLCTRKPGTVPTITNADQSRQHFTFRCELRAAEPILIDYDT